MLDHPFLASAIARLPMRCLEGVDWCQTMATDGFNIFINPDFAAGLNKDELQFVIAHELMHCLLGHFDRQADRDRSVWNIATDYATNLMLADFGLTMPPAGLIDDKYRRMTAEKIYEELQSDSTSKSDDPASSSGTFNILDQAGTSSGVGAPGFDVHLISDDPRSSALTKDVDSLSVGERRRLRATLARDFSNMLHETLAGAWQEEISMAGKKTIPWQALLGRFISGLRTDDYRLFPPNKKHLWRGLYLPSVGVPGPSHVVVAIDTSGSLSSDDLRLFLAEMDALRSVTQCKMTVIQCDADIQEIKTYEAYETTDFDRFKAKGRGWTDFIPVFTWVKETPDRGDIPPDAIIYMTDGWGAFPPEPPYFPTLWITTPNSNPDFPFGEVVCMEN